MIRNGNGAGIDLQGPEALIQGLNINGANAAAIVVGPGAWNARIVQNEIHNVNVGVQSAGFGTVAQANRITGSSDGITFLGDGGKAIGNKIENGVAGISSVADGTVVQANDVRHQSEHAIQVNGSDPTIQGNRVYGAEIGIQVNCPDCFGGAVVGNSVTDATSYGILASADDFGLVLQRNTLLRTGLGLSLNGIGITARLNKVTEVGLDIFGHCIEAFVSDPASTIDWNTVAQNTVTGCSQAGIYINGNQTLVDRNVVSGTFENGITIDELSESVVVSGNKATGNAAQGIAVIEGADDTVVSGNTAIGNRRDFCDDGTGTSVTGNTFGTSFDTPGVDCTIGH
jgi:parallel beta-helix repeat protein